MRQQFLEDIAGTFQLYVYDSNLKAVPSSATLTVYKPASTEKLLNAVSMTVASDGLLSYALTTAHNADAGLNYKATVIYVLNSVTRYLTVYYDIVRSLVSKVITDADIIAELPQLRDNGYKFTGTADSGSTTTIVDAELKRYEDDYFTGGLAYSITQDATRVISDFVASTGTVTTAAFASAVATDKYILTRSFTKEIDRAFEKLEDWLNKQGKRAHLILDPEDLREIHIAASVGEICKGLATTTDANGYWWALWKEYEAKTNGLYRTLNLKYDESQDGYIASSETDTRLKRTIARG